MSARMKVFVLLAILAFGLYGASLHYAPFFDDINFFERGVLNEIFLNGFAVELRWLPYFTMAWLDLIFDDSVLLQRSVSVGVHVLTAFVLYSLVKQVSDRVAPHRNNERAAVAAALLFLLHPLAVYAVGYLVQRTILMATLFGLLSLSAYFEGLVTRKKAYFFFSALFYLLSAFSKEHAILIPAVALALTPLVERVTLAAGRRLVLPLALFVPIALLVIYKSQSVLGQIYEPHAVQQLAQIQFHAETAGTGQVWYLSAITQASLFFKYLGLMLFPNPGWMSIDMRVPLATQPWELKYVLGAAAFAMYGLVALFLLLKGGRRGLIGFSLLAPWLLFAVEFSTVKVQEPFVLYRTYLWMWPLFLLVPAISRNLSNKLFWALVLGVALALAYASSDRLKSFSSGYALWDDAVRKLPEEQVTGAARVYANRGNWNAKGGNLPAAIADFTSALRADSRFKGAYTGRAFAYAKLGDFDSALRDANALILLYPEDPSGYTLRGLIYRDKGDFALAIAELQHACDMRSRGACVALSVTKWRAHAAGSSDRPQ